MKSLGQTTNLDKEQFLLGYLTDEQVRDAAASAVRIAGQEYAKAKSDFARRHEPKRGPTAARVQARYRPLPAAIGAKQASGCSVVYHGTLHARGCHHG